MSDVPPELITVIFSHLPELITVIFSHLPVKSLLRFRCVSKSYRALIDSPYFIKSHLNQSLISNSHKTLITMNSNNTDICSTDFDSLYKFSLLSPRATRFIGSCNGLLCLSDGIRIMNGFQGLLDSINIFLFNPSTREYRELPPYNFDASGGHFSFFCDNAVHGFGYDCVNDDYKVVQIIRCDDENCHDDFVICSLKSNSWRRILNFPYYICRNADNVFINGALHWVVTLERQTDGFVISNFNVDVRIVCFDLATEEYRFVPQPEISDKNLLMNVGELGGRLCLHYISKGNYMDLWVMDRYGVKESWTKLLSIVQPVDMDSWTKLLSFVQHFDIRKIKYLKAIAYSVDGERVLFEQRRGKLFWYDLKLKRKHGKCVKLHGGRINRKVGICMGSLVKLTGVTLLQEQV